MSESLNEGRHQVKRRYGAHGRIRVNENGAKVRETIIKYIGKNYVTEEDLHNHLIRLEEDRGGVKVNKAKWFARNQKLFSTFEKRGNRYYSLSKYGMRVLELMNNKVVKKTLNESNFKNMPSLSEWISVNEAEAVNEKYNKKSLLKKLGDADDATIQTGNGREYIIYNPNNGNDDNTDMWGDKTIFALDQDGGEHEIAYKDIGLVII